MAVYEFDMFYQTTKNNRKARDEENLGDPSALHDMLDGPMMYYIMRQIGRARRRVSFIAKLSCKSKQRQLAHSKAYFH